MPSVSDEFVVQRPLEAVFDLVTTASLWPLWHPATRAVEGDIDHPARLGDRITEHVTIAGVDGSGTWTVVEHDRPHGLVLAIELPVGPARIRYHFSAPDAAGTRFRRELEFPELGPAVDAAMAEQSTRAMVALARLVEERIPAG